MPKMDPSKEGLLGRDRERHYEDAEAGRASEDSDIDATEYLTSADPLHSSSATVSDKPAFLGGRPQTRWSIRQPLKSRGRCCICVLVVMGVIWILLGAGGAFVYKKYQEEPPYGLSPPWYPTPKGGTAAPWAESYAKAAAMVSRMTLPEKVNITTGTGWMMGLAVGTNGPAERVGFPQLQLQDGPLGIRFSDNSTAFPAGITVGATWNRELMFARGAAHGAEARGKGINVLLGPCVGPLGRMPAAGRNWEGFGADPYLQGVAGAETIRGIQSEGVMATVKHFVANEQEHFRQPWEWGLPHALSANIDDRTLHELYAWPFADAVRAGVASIMCSYNMVNNSYACGNSKLLNGILKDELGFQGFVMSDWLAQRSGVGTALAGLDMTMPGDGLGWQDGKSLWGPELTRSVLNGSVPMARLNDMATRIVAAWYQMGQDDETKFPRKPPNFSSWTNDPMDVLSPGSKSPQERVEVNKFVKVQGNHSIIARTVAAEGIVLLKNDNVLPLSRDGGTDAKLRNRHSANPKIGIFGEDAGPGKGANFCKDRGCNQGTLASGWGSGAVEFPYLVTPVETLRAQFDPAKVKLVEFLDNTPPFEKNPAVFEDLDLCIVFANADSGEGFLKWSNVAGDRSNLNLQLGGDDLIMSVSKYCGAGKADVVVVIHAVGPVLMEQWIDLPNVKAVLLANLPGQESGNALADVLFGVVNPSGHLPYTIARTAADYGDGGQVMYMPNGVIPQQDFSEGVFVDYRRFDKLEIAPRFEFGFGLSYTTFSVNNTRVSPKRPKTALPAARPAPGAKPPQYSDEVPDEHEVQFPENIRRLQGYVYPYLDSAEEIVSEPYPYPDGYDTVQEPSGAGGGEGGNPDLWETYVSVTVDVTNTGAVRGQTVVQLYVAFPTTREAQMVTFPVKVLRGFDKIMLDRGEKRSVEFNVTRRDLSYWDVEAQNWRIVTGGQYTFLVGQSSRDLTAFGTW